MFSSIPQKTRRTAVAEWLRMLTVTAVFGVLYIWRGGAALLFLLTAGLLIMLGGLLLQLLGPRKLQINRRIVPAHPVAGDTLTVEVKLSFCTRLPLPWMMIADEWDGGCHRELLFPGFRRSLIYAYPLEQVPRGVHRLRSCTVTWGDLPGMFTGARLPESKDSFKVLPRAFDLHRVLPDSGMAAGAIVYLRHGRAAGCETADIRDYAPGDPLSRIHWKNSARKGTLQSKVPEREQGRMSCIVLANDPGSYAIPPALLPPRGSGWFAVPAFERAVSAAAGLLLEAERTGAYVQLFSGGWPEGMARYEGLGQLPGRVRDLLTEIAPDGARSLAGLLEDASRHWIPGMTVTVVTGRLEEEPARVLAGYLMQGIKVELFYIWDQAAPGKAGAAAVPAPPAPGHGQIQGDTAMAPSGLQGASAPGGKHRPLGTIAGSLLRLGARLYCLDDTEFLPGHREASIHEFPQRPTQR